MIPQPDPKISGDNPLFATLYRDLEKHRLNANGSSKVLDSAKLKERKVFEETLHRSRVEEAEREVLKEAVGCVAYRGEGLPDELQQVVQIVSAQLEGKIEVADREIAEREIEYFLQEIDSSAPVVANHMIRNTSLLSQLLDPSEQQTDLSSSLHALKNSIITSRTNLSSSRASLTTQAVSLATLYTTAFETAIRILEQVIHGSVARHSKAQAAYLAIVAEGIEKKYLVLKAQVINNVYDTETRALLEESMEEVEGEIRRAWGVLRRREGWLGRLEGQGRGLEKIAEDVVALRAEIERVREEVERLEGGSS